MLAGLLSLVALFWLIIDNGETNTPVDMKVIKLQQNLSMKTEQWQDAERRVRILWGDVTNLQEKGREDAEQIIKLSEREKSLWEWYGSAQRFESMHEDLLLDKKLLQEQGHKTERELEKANEEINRLRNQGPQLRGIHRSSTTSQPIREPQSARDLMTFRDSGYESYEAEVAQPKASERKNSMIPMTPQNSRIASGRMEQKVENLKADRGRWEKKANQAREEQLKAEEEIERIIKSNEERIMDGKKAAEREREELTAQKEKAENDKREAESAKNEAETALEETKQKLRNSKESLKKKDDLLNKSNGDLEAAGSKVKELQDSISASNENERVIRENYARDEVNNVWRLQVHPRDERIRELLNKIGELENLRDRVLKGNENYEIELQGWRTLVEAVVKNLNLEEKVGHVNDLIHITFTLGKQIEKAKTEYISMEAKAGQLEEKSERLQQALKQAQTLTPDDWRMKFEDKNAECVKLEDGFGKVQVAKSLLNKSLTEKERKLSTSLENARKWEKRALEAERERDGTRNNNETYRQNIQRLRDEKQSLDETIGEHQREIQELTGNCTQLKHDIEGFENEKQKLSKEVQKLEVEKKKLFKTIAKGHTNEGPVKRDRDGSEDDHTEDPWTIKQSKRVLPEAS
ncbi:MAG: hypothetical protein Q9218_005028 [Villophora microphyllina]